MKTTITSYTFQIMFKTNLAHSIQVQKFINDRLAQAEQTLYDISETKFRDFKREMEDMGFMFHHVEKTTTTRVRK